MLLPQEVQEKTKWEVKKNTKTEAENTNTRSWNEIETSEEETEVHKNFGNYWISWIHSKIFVGFHLFSHFCELMKTSKRRSRVFNLSNEPRDSADKSFWVNFFEETFSWFHYECWKCFENINDENYSAHVRGYNKRQEHSRTSCFGCTEDDFQKVVSFSW